MKGKHIEIYGFRRKRVAIIADENKNDVKKRFYERIHSKNSRWLLQLISHKLLSQTAFIALKWPWQIGCLMMIRNAAQFDSLPWSLQRKLIHLMNTDSFQDRVDMETSYGLENASIDARLSVIVMKRKKNIILYSLRCTQTVSSITERSSPERICRWWMYKWSTTHVRWTHKYDV